MTTLAGDIVAWKPWRISTKAEWADAWTVHDGWLTPVDLSLGAYPTVDALQMIWRYGAIQAEGQTSFETLTPIDLLDRFVRLELNEGTDAEPDWQLLFVGVIVADTRRIDGTVVRQGGIPTGDQTLVAYGLEWLWEKVRIDAGWVSNDGTSQTQIRMSPPFNARAAHGLAVLGNRAANATPWTRYDGKNRFTHTFGRDGEPWDHLQVVEYLLGHYAPRGVGIDLAAEGQHDWLSTIIASNLDLSRHTLREAIGLLIDRRRGFGWRIDWESDTSPITNAIDPDDPNNARLPKLRVFSMLDAAVSFTGSEAPDVPANDRGFELNNASIEPRILLAHMDVQESYGLIRVSGEPVRVCFSVSFADGTLEANWSTSAEQAYTEVAAGSAVLNDLERAGDAYSRVYQSYRIPDNWGWRVQDGEGTGPLRMVNIALNDLGEVDPFVESGIRGWSSARTLLRSLPLERGGTGPEGQIEYREPFVLVWDPTLSKYGYLNAMPDPRPSASLRMLDSEMGIHIEANPNHVLGLNHFAPGSGQKSQVNPAYAYETLIATVAAELDEPLRVTATVAGGDLDRVLEIQVPGAQLWWIVSGTVIDVANGQLVRHQPIGAETDPYPVGNLLRSDATLLQGIAQAAVAWYGRRRTAVQAAFQSMTSRVAGTNGTEYPLRPGLLLERIYESANVNIGSFLEAGTVITEVSWDFDAGICSWRTEFAELDFGRRA